MKLAQFRTQPSTAQRLGVVADERLIDVAALAERVRQSGGRSANWLLETTGTLDVIRRGDEALGEISALVEAARSGGALNDEGVAFAPGEAAFLPAVNPSKILAIGRNYVDHAIEGGAEPPAAPLVFTKLPNSLSAHGAPIVLPAISTQVDYEAELAVVMGRRCRRVSEREALDYVFGYTLINDVSARDLQFGDGQWVRGKSLDSFAALGPFITTRDEIEEAHSRKIQRRLNGGVMQSSNTGTMIFRVHFLVS